MSAAPVAAAEIRPGLAVELGPEPTEPARVVAAMARLLAPPRANDPPPPWLLPHQVEPFRRARGTLAEYRGAMIALPVGTGKSFIALAGAGAPDGPPVQVIGPAVLAGQWTRTAGLTGIPIRFTSHERLSRGPVALGPGPVVIDESHRFRNPATIRHRTLAPLLRGRRVLLVTATPIVNRTADLAAQLSLAVPDDALWLEGVPSLAAAFGEGGPVGAVGRLLVTRIGIAPVPGRRERSMAAGDDPELGGVIARIDRLALSRDPVVAGLIRRSLYRAAASSPAALLGSVARYRRLLDHARAARAGGHRVNRAAIRAAIGDEPDQLLLWELLESGNGAADLAVRDAAPLERLAAQARAWRDRGDAKLVRLRELLAGGAPTVVFTAMVDTVEHLRARLGGPPAAWITGSRAGIGPLRASRTAVLASFRPGAERSGWKPPSVLIASDVAAEGLDLQRAVRVVHYDLPWTAVRLAQRDGRVARQGSAASEVELIRFGVPPAIEARLGIAAAVARKGRLAGIIERLDWADRIAERHGDADPAGGWAATDSGYRLAGVAVTACARTAGLVLAAPPGGDWTDRPEEIDRALARVSAARARPAGAGEVAATLDSLLPRVNGRVAALNGWALFGGRPRGEAAVVADLLARWRRWGDRAALTAADRLRQGEPVGARLVALIL